jgi:hypothetical protein
MALEWTDYSKLVKSSLADLFKHDKDLFRVDVNERTISHKFAEYFRIHFANLVLPNPAKEDTVLQPFGYSVDCEYNRAMHAPKHLPWQLDIIGKENELYYTPNPDMLLHRRLTNEFNELVTEIKKTTNNDPVSVVLDKQKLVAFAERPFSYDFGLFLVLGLNNDDCEVAEAKLVTQGTVNRTDEQARHTVWERCRTLIMQAPTESGRVSVKPKFSRADQDEAVSLMSELERLYKFQDVLQDVKPCANPRMPNPS